MKTHEQVSSQAAVAGQAAPGGQSRAHDFSAEELAERMLHRRAVEAVIWGMAAVNTDLMYQAMARETKGRWNQIE